MTIRLSPVIAVQMRQVPGFTALKFVDLRALGVYASPVVVLDDFRVTELPFSAHPHAGFAAVTYVFEDSAGSLRSRTSIGTDEVVSAGGVVWTQAGRGLVHEEIPADKGVELHGLQLFVNLTSEHKLSAPRVFVLHSADVPIWECPGGRVRVVVGTFEGLSSPLVTDEPFTMLDVELETEISYPLEAGENTVLYVMNGDLRVRSGDQLREVGEGHALALTGARETVGLDSTRSAHFLILSGVAINDPIVEEGPFIMNSRIQIEAALARYRSGEMGGLSPA